MKNKLPYNKEIQVKKMKNNQYFIRSPDSDPRNFSEKRLILEEDGRIIGGNNQWSDNWDNYTHNHENIKDACRKWRTRFLNL